jgi:hypothetical protein
VLPIRAKALVRKQGSWGKEGGQQNDIFVENAFINITNARMID